MAVPIDIGTCGTVGSLLKIEIDYFRRIEVERVNSCMNVERNLEETTSTGRRNSWRGLRSLLVLPWRRKKRRNSGIRSAGMCATVDVAENPRLGEIPGFSYQNLRADSNRFDV